MATLLIGLDILGLIFGVTGAILVGKLNKLGFIAFIVGSTAHGTLGLLQGNWGLMTTCLVFIVIDVYFFIEWSKNEKPKQT